MQTARRRGIRKINRVVMGSVSYGRMIALGLNQTHRAPGSKTDKAQGFI